MRDRLRLAARETYNIALETATPLISLPKDRQKLFILGSGRSGTSAIMEAFATGLSATAIFDPLHRSTSRWAKQVVPDHGYPRLHPCDASPEMRDYLDAVLSMRKVSRWSLAHTSMRTVRDTDALVVKEVRANRMAGWLQRQYPDIPVIVVVRHPLSVVESMLRNAQGVERDAV